ncbi:hypothetical protein GCM10011391_20310 [Pullulanibacillus camelliae]|uniref:Uncharacterized protein n=1 Tax=Pullulanibacillus camelliae TaxID=1707096 RepID=A0A8J2VZS8_9BACL|nr:hypothetical protein GCM10011391_20310 [Pullulanibacillus camelliae]
MLFARFFLCEEKTYMKAIVLYNWVFGQETVIGLSFESEVDQREYRNKKCLLKQHPSTRI